MDTASCKAGGSIIPNEVPVTAGLVERLSDANPNPFTKFILILFLRINPKWYLPLSRAAQTSWLFFTNNSNVEVDWQVCGASGLSLEQQPVLSMEVRRRERLLPWLLLDPVSEKALTVPGVGLLTAPRHGAIHTTSAHGITFCRLI